MWKPDIIRRLGQFQSAVLSFTGADGYPYSVRCVPQADEANQALRIPATLAAPVQTGLAGLLYHSHDENLWMLKSIQILGRIEPAAQGWIFYPEQYIPGGAFAGQLAQMRWIFKARAEANKYLAKKGLARPKVRWDEFSALKDEAKRAVRR